MMPGREYHPDTAPPRILHAPRQCRSMTAQNEVTLLAELVSETALSRPRRVS